MATYTRKFVEPYPGQGYMDKPNKVSAIISQHLNNFVLTFKSLEDFAVANSITPNPDVSGLEPAPLVAIQIGNDKYILSATTDLDSLTDVEISDVEDGQVLAWDNTNSKWVNINAPSSVDDLNDLEDVNISSPTDGQVMTYDAVSSKWVNGAAGGTGNAIRVILTKAQYDALPASKLSDDKLYFITDWRDQTVDDASNISYDNTTSGLLANNLQDAIDELLGV